MDNNKPAQNIQDSFLNTARKERASITIYLLSGVKLTGRIRSFDKYSVVLEANGQEQLIFKHAISTVVMGRVASTHVAHAAHPEKSVAGRGCRCDCSDGFGHRRVGFSAWEVLFARSPAITREHATRLFCNPLRKIRFRIRNAHSWLAWMCEPVDASKGAVTAQAAAARDASSAASFVCPWFADKR